MAFFTVSRPGEAAQSLTRSAVLLNEGGLAKLRRKIARPVVLPILTRLGGGALIAMGVVTATFRRSAS